MPERVLLVVYDHPSDYPEHYVLRKWVFVVDPLNPQGEPGAVPTLIFFLENSLEAVHKRLPAGAAKILVLAGMEDPAIAETWLADWPVPTEESELLPTYRCSACGTYFLVSDRKAKPLEGQSCPWRHRAAGVFCCKGVLEPVSRKLYRETKD